MTEKAWKRSWDGALACGGEEKQSSKSIVASEEENSDAEIIIKKKSQTCDLLGVRGLKREERTTTIGLYK